MIEVALTLGGRLTARHVLGLGAYSVGRNPGNFIVVDCPDVSERHARLVVEETKVRLEDLRSTNGTFLDGRAIAGSLDLPVPCRLQVGSAFLDVAPAKPAPTPAPAPPSEAATSAPGPEAALAQARNYHLGAEIAHGGMGAVWDVEDRNLDRRVAMKVILAAEAASRESRLRFIQEARILGQLAHPNIVPIHDLGLDAEGRVFYTMTRVMGVTLLRILSDIAAGDAARIAAYPLPRLLTVFQKAGDGVSFAHSQGVIHRDLKPDNIMVGEHGEVLVMDWGLAKRLRAVATDGIPEPEASAESEGMGRLSVTSNPAGVRTLEGRVMGTPHYMAPEQAAGHVDALDERTDIYALGGVLYHILTLRPPVRGKSLGEILESIRTGSIRPPSEQQRTGDLPASDDGPAPAQPGGFPHCANGKIPAALSAVAMRALSLHPADRYQTVGELQQDLVAYQNGFATSAELPGPWTLLRLWVRRHTAASAATAVVTAVLAIASVVVVAMWVELRGTAPVFVEKAQALMEQHRFAEALAPIQYALQRAPKQPESWMLQGHICESLLRLEDARVAYGRALALRPDLVLARQNLDLCERLLRDNPGQRKPMPATLVQLHEAMRSQGRTNEANAVLTRLLAQDQQQRQRFYRQWRAQLDRGGVAGELTLDDAGRVDLNLQGASVTNLAPLRGIPLSRLEVRETQVSDLAPLRGMPLEKLVLDTAPIRDLTPLKGMRLRELNLSRNAVTNLDALAGMPLQTLTIHGQTEVSDFRPLMGMPLTWLWAAYIPKLTNLAPLRGMPLNSLVLSYTPVSDLSPVLGAPIQHLRLDHTPFTHFAELTNFPLVSLEMSGTSIRDLSVLRPLALRELWLMQTPVSDLRPLAGLPLIGLALSGTRVTELSPLADMPLNRLHLDSTPVLDLQPLRNLPLAFLNLARTRVSDLRVLQTLPLEELWLEGCQEIRDLTPLTNLPTLRRLTLPPPATAVECLRTLTHLEQLGYTQPLLPAGEFWRVYDARRAQ